MTVIDYLRTLDTIEFYVDLGIHQHQIDGSRFEHYKEWLCTVETAQNSMPEIFDYLRQKKRHQPIIFRYRNLHLVLHDTYLNVL